MVEQSFQEKARKLRALGLPDDRISELLGRGQPAAGLGESSESAASQLEVDESVPATDRPEAKREVEQKGVTPEAAPMMDVVLNQGRTARTQSRVTPYGIAVAEGWDPYDPVFRRHPAECQCFRQGQLCCAVPCVWAWQPGAKIGDEALPLAGRNW